jgi:hypothetical protein
MQSFPLAQFGCMCSLGIFPRVQMNSVEFVGHVGFGEYLKTRNGNVIKTHSPRNNLPRQHVAMRWTSFPNTYHGQCKKTLHPTSLSLSHHNLTSTC